MPTQVLSLSKKAIKEAISSIIFHLLDGITCLLLCVAIFEFLLLYVYVQ